MKTKVKENIPVSQSKAINNRVDWFVVCFGLYTSSKSSSRKINRQILSNKGYIWYKFNFELINFNVFSNKVFGSFTRSVVGIPFKSD